MAKLSQIFKNRGMRRFCCTFDQFFEKTSMDTNMSLEGRMIFFGKWEVFSVTGLCGKPCLLLAEPSIQTVELKGEV